MKLIRTLKSKLILWIFEREFRYFVYPFESVDSVIAGMDIDDQLQYYLEIKKIVSSKAFKMEITELKKLFYKELAINTSDDIIRAAYRLNLLFIRKVERRFRYLTTKAQELQNYESNKKR